VSSDACHRGRTDLIVLAVTSQARPRAALGEAPITGWKEAGLLRAALLEPVIATRERSPVARQLEEEDRAALRAVLDEILG
jgi:mRNA interferase MazF